LNNGKKVISFNGEQIREGFRVGNGARRIIAQEGRGGKKKRLGCLSGGGKGPQPERMKKK